MTKMTEQEIIEYIGMLNVTILRQQKEIRELQEQLGQCQVSTEKTSPVDGSQVPIQ